MDNKERIAEKYAWMDMVTMKLSLAKLKQTRKDVEDYLDNTNLEISELRLAIDLREEQEQP